VEAGTTSGEGTFHGGKMLVSSREGGRYEGTIKVPAGGYASSSSSGRLDLGVGEWLLPRWIVSRARWVLPMARVSTSRWARWPRPA
jgi:hypothetical protein